MELKSRVVLAANLKALMEARPSLATFPQIVVAGGPSNGTLDRIRRQKAGCSIDQLDALAYVFDLDSSWQLLVPNMHATNLPVLKATSEAEIRFYKKMADATQELTDSLKNGGNTRPGSL